MYIGEPGTGDDAARAAARAAGGGAARLAPQQQPRLLHPRDLRSQTELRSQLFDERGELCEVAVGDAVGEEAHGDKGTVDVSVNFVGRPTPMSLGYWEVEPI